MQTRCRIESSQSSSPARASADDHEAVVKNLITFYVMMGHMPEEPGAVAAMAEALCQDASVESIQCALTRCMKECRFPVRLPDIFSRIQGQEVPKIEAEMRGAWDVLIKFVDKWCRWNDGYFTAHVEKDAPELPQRIMDTVRRTGGWAVYLGMERPDFPHQQKRFFEEYQAWIAVEHLAPDFAKVLQLPEAPAQPKQLAPAPQPIKNPDPVVKTFAAKSPPEPPTCEQLRDRREMLRQQAETLKAKRAQPESRLPIPLIESAEDAGRETVQ